MARIAGERPAMAEGGRANMEAANTNTVNYNLVSFRSFIIISMLVTFEKTDLTKEYYVTAVFKDAKIKKICKDFGWCLKNI